MANADAYREVVEAAERELARRSPRENLRVARALRTLTLGLAAREQRVLDAAAFDFDRRAEEAEASSNSAAS